MQWVSCRGQSIGQIESTVRELVESEIDCRVMIAHSHRATAIAGGDPSDVRWTGYTAHAFLDDHMAVVKAGHPDFIVATIWLLIDQVDADLYILSSPSWVSGREAFEPRWDEMAVLFLTL